MLVAHGPVEAPLCDLVAGCCKMDPAELLVAGLLRKAGRCAGQPYRRGGERTDYFPWCLVHDVLRGRARLGSLSEDDICLRLFVLCRGFLGQKPAFALNAPAVAG